MKFAIIRSIGIHLPKIKLMQKSMLLLGFLLLHYFTAFGQFGLDISVGSNFSKISGGLGRSAFLPSAVFGIQPNYQITPKVNVGIGLQFSNKVIGYASNLDFRSKMVDISPKAEYQVVKNLSLYAGLNLGIYSAVEVRGRPIGSWVRPIVSLTKQADLGGLFGVKYRYKAFYGYVQYVAGLTPATDIQTTDAQGNVNYKENDYLQSLQVGLGYRFSWTRKS